MIEHYDDAVKESKTTKEFKVMEEQGKIFKDEFSSMLMYSRMKVPMMSERENLLRSDTIKKGEKKFMFFQNTEDHPDIPVKKGCVRMTIHKAVLVEQVGADIHTTEYSTLDMGGYFPTRLMNMMLSAMMKNNVPQFKKLMDKSKAALAERAQ